MALTTYKWSIDRWQKLVETGVLADRNVELLEGEIVEMSPEGIPHTFTNRNVGRYLERLLEGKAIISEGYPITLDNSELRPDITILRLPENIYLNHHPYPEDIYLLIEISKSTLQIDKTTKATTYARNNIQEYWIVDLVNKKLIVHTQPQESLYQKIEEYQTGVIYSRAFPNIAIAMSRILLF